MPGKAPDWDENMPEIGGDYRQCRRKIVAWDVNPPAPFPGFGGTVGLGQDVAVLDNGDWLLVFHAGYWHMSMATPFVLDPELLRKFREEGGTPEIEAPQGGRIMAIRSTDQGKNWSEPETVLNGRWDESPVGLSKLSDGTLLLVVNNQASWYGESVPEAPPGHLEVNTRIGIMRSTDHGFTWSGPVWLESPLPFYQRAYAQPLELSDGTVLLPTYSADGYCGHLCGGIHASTDGGQTWRLRGVIERDDGEDLDEPSIIDLPDGRLMLTTRLDAALFYSEDQGRSWVLSHKAPFAPLKPCRLRRLADDTIVCWMTSHGVLRASWSTDCGKTWAVDAGGKPFALDPEHYGYPGGCLLEDESVFAVYYDAANRQRRTGVWGIRFRIDDARECLEILPAPGAGDGGPQTDRRRQDELDADSM